MLNLLGINNIAVISHLEIEFAPGLNLLTGETGAGKSILVDALGLLLGQRGSPELLRTGEERGSVEGAFEAGPEALSLLQDRGLAAEGREVFVRREVLGNGKARATVNGALVPLGLLRELGPRLCLLHGQHEPHELLDPRSHLRLLDRHGGLEAAAAEVGALFERFRAVHQALEARRRERRDAEKRRELLEFQAGEIERGGLRLGEEEELRQEKAIQANAGRLASLAAEAYALLYDREDSVLTMLGQAMKRVEDLAALDPRFASHLAARDDVRAPLQDLALVLRDYGETVQVRPGRLDEIESRLHAIDRLKRRYGGSVAEAIAVGEACRAELQALGDPEEEEKRLAAELSAARALYTQAALGLSEARRPAAADLQARVERELGLLAMEKTRFRVAFQPDPPAPEEDSTWGGEGLDRVEFLLAPNVGEDLRPLARVASGGEMSRVVLALKSVGSLAGAGRTLVFDEVDAGIGGRVAEVVGRKLRALAARHQVLCVTHLPQIACLADAHFAVAKRVAGGRTETQVRRLGEEERVEELARMLGGERVTETAREHARELVRQGGRGEA
jgi:DNA repair protein RecN (Recombination protein N)